MDDVAAARADRAVFDGAAARLRHRAVQEGYTGGERKECAFALALLLDELALHARDLEAGVRDQLVAAARIVQDPAGS